MSLRINTNIPAMTVLRNTQDAVNMAKTAEGALNEVSRLILSLRSLAIHSANTATIDATQLEASQSAQSVLALLGGGR